MTNKQAFEMLKNALDSVNSREYPEIYSVIHSCIDVEAEDVLICAYDIAQNLYDADAAKQFPKPVSDFLVKVYEEEVANGNADAACNLGALYYTGRIGAQNYSKAIEYYKLAADGGCRQARENLGYCYYYGRNVAVDYEKAFSYFALGAFCGSIASLYKIGDMYRNGFYVEKNEKEAFEIYNQCLKNIDDRSTALYGADVMLRLADCAFEGIGTDVDYEKALVFYQRAEQLFYARLRDGDFMIRGCYEKAVARQEQAREKLKECLPQYEWTKR